MVYAVVWRGVTIDDRMAAQMDEVVRLVGPDVNVRPTQGANPGGVAASAGTHDKGGAIDLAGQDAGMTQTHRELIRDAGRQVGIAMWIRDPSQSDWPWHLHGISVQPGGKWDQGCLSSGAHGQVVDYYEGRNGLASGAADDGPRQWVGVTWETYAGAPPTTPPPPTFNPEGVDMLVAQDSSNGKIYLVSGNTKLEFPGGGYPDGGGDVYVDELLAMIRAAYPDGPEPRLVALNGDVANRIPTRTHDEA